MTASPPVPDSFEQPSGDELVTFTVLCQPASGIGIEEFNRRLAVSSLDGLLPADTTLASVAKQLRELRFEVFDIPGPVVFARGTVDRFEETFGAQLVKLTRQVSRDSRRPRTMTTVVIRPGTEVRSVNAIEGALLVTVAEPPLLAQPAMPDPGAKGTRDFCLRLPAGIARTTRASSTHRQLTPAGDRATGRGVVVAVIDTGFARHPFFTKHPYQITLLAAPDAEAPEVDEFGHGTPVLANLVACAPDARVYAIKYGERVDVAFCVAMAIPNVRVISLSWGYKRPSNLPDFMLILQFLIVFAVVAQGVTVIVASGNDIGETCPANRPEVISVGGVSFDNGSPEAWDGTSSFQSKFHPGRSAPDLCGIASLIRLPMPPPPKGKRYGWECADGGTSCAAPQVAGIAALLIQKKPSLTPHDVRGALMNNGTDILTGSTFTGDVAALGPDNATGGGLVNALKAWLSV